MSDRLSILDKPRRQEACPSSVTLEQYALAKSTVSEEGLAAHVAGCAECQGYIGSVRAKTSEFVQLRPADQFLRQLEARRAKTPSRFELLRRAWVWPSAGLATAAAVVLIVLKVLPHASTTPPDAPESRWKGERLQVYALRKGAATPELLSEGAKLRSGDTLRFVYTSTEPGELVILDLDGRGHASVFYPFGQAQARAVAAGETTALPGSIELDNSVGPEALVAVFSTRALDVPALLSELKAQRASERIRLSCRDCRVDVLKVEKLP